MSLFVFIHIFQNKNIVFSNLILIMSKSESLIKLVNSLSRQEKKEFSLYISNKEEKDYILLYKLIDERKAVDSAGLKKIFMQERPKASFNTAVTYLLDLLIGILASLRKEQDSYYSLFNEILKARILYEKNMYQECFQTLNKIKERAIFFENYFALLTAQRLELNYLLALDFNDINETELLAKQHKMSKTLKVINQLNAQSSLYELLKLRILSKGASRSVGETRSLDDLVTSEISIVASARDENFEIKKNHQLFQANYFMTVGDYKAAYNSFVELNKLFEDNTHLWNNPPVYYLMTIEGVLEGLRAMHHYNGMLYFIAKLENIKSSSASFQLNLLYVIFKYRLCSCIDKGEFGNASQLIQDYRGCLIEKIFLLKEHQQAEMSLYVSLVYLGNKEYKKAKKQLRHVLNRQCLYSTDLYRIIRIVNVMINFELGDYDYIQSEIRSIKRKMSKSKDHNLKVESFILKFLDYSLDSKLINSKRSDIWKNMSEEAQLLYSDKYETQILRRFDFVAWVESKILNVPLATILKESCISK